MSLKKTTAWLKYFLVSFPDIWIVWFENLEKREARLREEREKERITGANFQGLSESDEAHERPSPSLLFRPGTVPR